ncbi:hypothetical protein CDV36_013436 [Fusarium kuroshium]|uniref:C3H1-type domain-containing protein n=1 Tax=Fusarium kuroshium TaxID=2010991 RepID=A0A3M2RP32_9HYPO|nr:hypothetical protein CDV36_013436 [Fusarium kuroshium]
MSVHLAEDFEAHVTAIQAAEEERVAWLKGFAGQLSDVVSKYRDATRDLDSEKVARRFSQQEAEEWRTKFEMLQKSMEKSSFVLVLIDADADSYIFNDEYYSASDGGRKASLDLRDRVRVYLQSERPELANHSIVVKAYANELGLSQFLVASGTVKSPRDLLDFAKDFTQASETTDFVLVGSGKDRADKKIQGAFRQFVGNPTCRHVIFGACHDNSYVRLLEDYAHDESVVERVTLLHGFSVGREFHQLGFKSMTMSGVFRDGAVQDERPSTRQPQPTSHSATVPTMPTWATAVGSKADPGPRGSDSVKGAVRVNMAGQRIDQDLRDPPQRAQDSWKHKTGKAGMRYCRPYHLVGSCSSPACVYSHGPLSDEEKLVFRRQVRMEPCHTGLQCRDATCFYGHNCSCKKLKCKFSPEMHKVDVSQTKSCVD